MNTIQSRPTFAGTRMIKSTLTADEFAKKFERYFDFKPISASADPSKALNTTEIGIQTTKDGIKFIGKDEKSDKMFFHLIKKFDKHGKYEYADDKLPKSAKIDTKA